VYYNIFNLLTVSVDNGYITTVFASGGWGGGGLGRKSIAKDSKGKYIRLSILN
jgi:hypothetical protein